MTAAPIVPLDLLCASGTSYFGRPADPLRARRPGRRRGRAVGDAGPRAPGCSFATTAGMAPGRRQPGRAVRRARRGRRARCRTASPTTTAAALGHVRRGGVDGAHRPGAAAARGSACSCSAPGARWGRWPSAAAKLLGAGRVVAVCRSRGRRRSGRAAPAPTRWSASIRRRRRLTAALRGRRRRAASTSSSTRCSASRPPRPSRVLAPRRAAGEPRRARPATSPSSPPPSCAAAPPPSSATRTTTLTPEQRRTALDRRPRARRRGPAGRRARGAPAGRRRRRVATAGRRRGRRAAGAHPLTRIRGRRPPPTDP